MFFTFFKLYIWYQIAQRTTNGYFSISSSTSNLLGWWVSFVGPFSRLYKSSRLKVFCKKGVLKKVFSCEFREILKNRFFYRIYPGDCYWISHNSFFFKKMFKRLVHPNFIFSLNFKKRLWQRCLFPREFAKFLRTPFL